MYHINTVDEITQYEHIGTVQAISERFFVPVLEALIDAYPFEIVGFHADNGSEYMAPIRMRQFIFTHTSGPVPRPAVLGVGGVQ